MTGRDKAIRWRLIGISATDDETRHAAVVSAPDGQTREYVFSRDATTIGGEPAVIWHTGGWDRHALFDMVSYKAVLNTVLAFNDARQRTIALGDADDRKPPPGSLWRLIGIRATEDDSRYVGVVSAPDGQTREYPFVQQPITVGGEPAFMWDTNEWDRDTLFDRASYKAVLDAVHAFYEARQREMALGDDEERKPPGL